MRRTHDHPVILGLVAAMGMMLLAARPVAAQFDANNTVLQSWLDLATLGGSSGNDCWGYVSPSGREYALMGVRNSLTVVEITDPQNPVITAQIGHTNSLWGDIKVFGAYAYVVNESGGGMDIVNLSGVDSGVVTLVQSFTGSGLSTSHNIAINPDSGFLYLAGSNLSGGRLVAFDLTDPENPVFAGAVDATQGVYVHDAQIVTYTTGPNAGKEIAFCANGGTGLDIYDVTNKANMFRLSRTTYTSLAYAHQCWLSADKQYLYLNDELDSINRTTIFDVSNLASPSVINTVNSGVSATDHNLYVHNGFIYEAEYHAGLRVFDASDPTNPVQVGWFDSYPEDDAGGFDGAWSVYPFFPSGSILISDINRGLFVVKVGEPLLDITYPSGRPSLINPTGQTMQVQITELQPGALVPGSAMLHYNDGSGWVQSALAGLGGDLYEAAFGPTPCTTDVRWYISAEMSNGLTFFDPVGAPGTTYAATSAVDLIIHFEDHMETNPGWTVENVAILDGAWDPNPSVPIGGGVRGDPVSDFDGSGKCWLTDNVAGNSDVDGGPTRLITPIYDLSGISDPFLSYARWFTNDDADLDRLDVEVSSNGGATWVLVESVPGGTGWTVHSFRVSDFVTPNNQIRLRFSATDNPNDSVTEAAIDDLRILTYICDTGIVGDLNGDGVVDVLDLLELLAGWGPCAPPCPPSCPADLNDDCAVDVLDLLDMLANWG